MNDTASSHILGLGSSMTALGLSQFLSSSMHQACHILDLILEIRIIVDLEAIDTVSWSEHFAVCLSIPSPPVYLVSGFMLTHEN